MSKLIEKFAKNVRDVCYANDISISDLEKNVGMSKGYLSRMEKGSVDDIRVSLAIKIAREVGYPVDELAYDDFSEKVKEKDIEKVELEIESLQKKVQELRGNNGKKENV